MLPEVVENVARQTYTNFEIVVVDDGSRDVTEEIVRSLTDARVHYICHPENRGLAAARNTGIRAARGEFVAFLDDDDKWQPEKLSRQLRAIEGHEAVLAGALVNGRYLKLHGRAQISPDDLRKGNSGSMPPSGLFARTAVMREVWFDEKLRQGEDWDAYVRLALRRPIAYINEPLVLLSDGDHERLTNRARNLPLAQLEQRMEVFKKHREFLGAYWFRRLLAAVILSYLRDRSGKAAQVRYAIRRCGLLPVLGVLMGKLTNAWQRVKADAFARPG